MKRVPWVSHSALCQGTPVCSSSSVLGNKPNSKSLFSSCSPQTNHSHVQHLVNPILVFPVPSGLDRLVGDPQPPNPLLPSRTGNSRGPSCSFPALLCPASSRSVPSSPPTALGTALPTVMSHPGQSMDWLLRGPAGWRDGFYSEEWSL